MSDYEELEEAINDAADRAEKDKLRNAIKIDSLARLEGGIKSSGERRDFGTGAHRDSNTAVHKGRMDLIPAVAMHRFAEFCTECDNNPHDGKMHSLFCYNDAMESMYLWIEGERPKRDGGDYRFDNLANALWDCQQMMHMEEDEPLWYPSTSPDYDIGIRYDRISPILLRRVSIHYQLGGINYGDRNWEKGMPAMVTWDSAVRHLVNWLDRETTEDHLAAFAWNVMCTMHTIEMVNRDLLPSNMYDPPMHRNIRIGRLAASIFGEDIDDEEEDI